LLLGGPPPLRCTTYHHCRRCCNNKQQHDQSAAACRGTGTCVAVCAPGALAPHRLRPGCCLLLLHRRRYRRRRRLRSLPQTLSAWCHAVLPRGRNTLFWACEPITICPTAG
jgi:hypothetical protein